MAAKTEEEKAPSSSENLTCPLCLDIFDEATILTSCGTHLLSEMSQEL